MKKCFLSSLFVVSMIMELSLTAAPMSQPMIVQRRITYSPQKNVAPSTPVEDVIYLTDGSKIQGHLTVLPPLIYPFGSVPFRIQDAKNVKFSTDQGTWKMYIENIDGTNFISDFTDGSAIEVKGSDGEMRQIPFIDIISIDLNSNRSHVKPAQGPQMFMVGFKDGSLIPVRLQDATLSVNDGQKDYDLPLLSVVDVINDGGLHGIVLTKEGEYKHIPLAILKSQTLPVTITGDNKVTQLNWSDIIRVYKHNSAEFAKGLPPIKQNNITPSQTASPVKTVNAPANTSPAEEPRPVPRVVTSVSKDVLFVPEQSTAAPEIFPVNTPPAMPERRSPIAPIPKTGGTSPSAPLPVYPAVPVQSKPVLNNEPVKPLDNKGDNSLALETGTYLIVPTIREDSGATNYTVVGRIPVDNPTAGAKISSQPSDISLIGESITYVPKKRDPLRSSEEEENDAAQSVESPTEVKNEIQFTALEEKQKKYFVAKGGAVRKPLLAQSCVLRDEPLVAMTQPSELITKHSTDSYKDSDGYYKVPAVKIVPESIEDDEQDLSHDPDLAGMVFINEQEVACAAEGDLPESQEAARAFYIDKYPVTNKQYYRFVKSENYPRPKAWPAGRIPKGQDLQPITSISYQDALAYAEWAGKKLPSSSEWCRANNSHLIKFSTKRAIKEWTSTEFVAQNDSRVEKNWMKQNNVDLAREVYRAVIGGEIVGAVPVPEGDFSPSIGFRTALMAE